VKYLLFRSRLKKKQKVVLFFYYFFFNGGTLKDWNCSIMMFRVAINLEVSLNRKCKSCQKNQGKIRSDKKCQGKPFPCGNDCFSFDQTAKIYWMEMSTQTETNNENRKNSRETENRNYVVTDSIRDFCSGGDGPRYPGDFAVYCLCVWSFELRARRTTPHLPAG